MKIGYARGYRDGYEEGYARAKEVYAQQLAHLRGQLDDARVLVADANARADALFDQFMLKIGAQPVSAAAQTERRELAKQRMDRHGVVREEDPFEDLPFGAPGASYKTREEAALDAVKG